MGEALRLEVAEKAGNGCVAVCVAGTRVGEGAWFRENASGTCIVVPSLSMESRVLVVRGLSGELREEGLQ